MVYENPETSEVERWNYMLQGRRKHVWGKAAGLSVPTIDTVFSKGGATWSALRAAMYRDNANPRWLSEGLGAPYIATMFPTASLLAEQLELLLEDEQWEVILVLNPHLCGLILHQPGAFQRGKRMVDYRITEIIGGPVSRKIVPPLEPVASEKRLWLLDLNTEQLMQLIQGYVSNYALFEEPRLISKARPGKLSDLDHIQTPVEINGNSVDLDLLKSIIEAVEKAALVESKELTSEQKSKVISIAYKQALQSGLNAISIRLEQIAPLLDLAG